VHFAGKDGKLLYILKRDGVKDSSASPEKFIKICAISKADSLSLHHKLVLNSKTEAVLKTIES
jgi:hypothetical protein